jgi:hypothetical protein
MELGFGLARLMETTEAQNVAAWAAEHIAAGGGIASFAGPASPISHAIGVGMNGQVTKGDIDQIEEFYNTRGAASNIDLCPLADPSLMEELGRRGYRITEFNNVLVTALPKDVENPADSVRIVNISEAELWTRTMITGFFERDELTPDELALGYAVFQMPHAGPFLAEVDGIPAAAGAACANGPVLYLFGDSTLPVFRRKGLHLSLIRSRLKWRAANGCTLAFASTLPGSGSQRNYCRAGFTIAYTKLNMCRELG